YDLAAPPECHRMPIPAHPGRIVAYNQRPGGSGGKSGLSGLENQRWRNETIVASELEGLGGGGRVILAGQEVGLELLDLLGAPGHLLVREPISLLIVAIILAEARAGRDGL